MKSAILRYVSPLQTQLSKLRKLLRKCEPLGLAVERDPIGGRNYRIVNGEDVLSEFTTLTKLEIWIEGFEAGVKFKEEQQWHE